MMVWEAIAMKPTSVLLVEYDTQERARIGTLLEDEGFDVVVCPGPVGPDYVCLGGRGLPCPLAHPADVVVLDMRLASDVVMRGTPGWELLVYYMERGKPIVALSNEEDPVHPLSDDRVKVLKRHVDNKSLIRAVRDSVRPSILSREEDRGLDLAR
jgi:CheY-like chemotaxis protein